MNRPWRLPGRRMAVLLPALVLIVGLAGSAGGAWWLKADIEAEAEAEFKRIVQRDSAEISERFRKPLTGLTGARGLYATHAEVSRDTFRRFVDSLDMAVEFPGVRGFGFIRPLPRDAVDPFVAAQRASGAPQFGVRQLDAKEHPELFVIELIEPVERNAGAPGLDVGSEAVRRKGLLLAQETTEAVTTGIITLVQDERRSPGVLLYVPVYGDAPAAAEATAASAPGTPSRGPLRGFLYAPIVVTELLEGLADVLAGRVRLELFDTASGTAAGTPMFDSAASRGEDATAAPGARARFEILRPLDLPGRLVTLRASSTPAFEAAYTAQQAWLLGLGGALLSGLLAAFLRQQIIGRDRAESHARKLTADLGRLAMVASRTSNAVIITDAQRRITWVNEGFERITGYRAAEVIGRSPGAVLQTEGTDPDTVQALRQALSAGQGFRGEILNRGKQGRLYWLALDIQPLHDARGVLTGFMAVELDITERREMAAALEGSNQLLHSVLENLPCGLAVFDADLTLRMSNREVSRLLALPPHLVQPGRTRFEDVVRCNAERGDYGPAGTPEELEARVQAIVERARGPVLPHRFEHAGPGGITLEVRSGPLPGGGFVTTCTDITARRAAEAEAQRAAQLLRGAIDAIDEAFVIYDPEDRLVLCNDRYREVYATVAHQIAPGVRFEDLVRAGVQQGDFADAAGREEAWLAERVAAHRAADSTVIQALSDGRTLRIIERKLPDGHVVGFRIDITELVRATQRAERASHEAGRALARLQAIYDILPVGITITDPQGHIIDCNPAAERLLGIGKAEHLVRDCDGREWTILREDGTPMPPEEHASVRALKQRSAVHDAVMQVVAHDHSVWLSVSAMPVAHEDLGVVVGYVDITEQRAQQRALLEAKSQAENASEAKSRFLANMSHEIRTPMNAVLGMLALLKKAGLTARQADYAGKTEAAARSLLGLLDDILDFSKVEAGKMTLDPRPLRVDHLMRELAVILSAGVGVKPVELMFDIDPALPRRLVGDAMRLQQVLINLAGNAIKFTAEGEVVVSMRVLQRTGDEVTLRVAVRDTGIGIAPENQARIFSGFTQAEASTTRRFGGSGLGLAISRRLVALMGGVLQLDSALGRGSTFHFDLTLPVPAAAGDDERPVHAAARRALRALVVDDHTSARELVQGMARSLGWSADTAASGEAALALLAERRACGEHYDAVFVDGQMPGLDGWQTAGRMRAGGLLRDAPLVLMVTAHGREMLEQHHGAGQALLDGVLVKPVTASMLFDAVVDARRGRGQPHPSASVHTPPVGSAQRLAGLRLLVAEDNPNNQQVARELLEDEGARVQIAHNGLEAVQAVAAAEPPFDLVLMDLQMPLMDGFTATARIRQDLGHSHLPIVAMTANAMASDREACLAAGMNEHVGKPFDLDRLVAVLLRISGGAAVAGATAVPPPAAAPPAAAPPTAALPAAALSAPVLRAADDAGVDLAAALRRLGGRPAVVERMLRNFLAELARMPDTLARQAQAAAPREVSATLHTLKGLAATLGADGLWQVASNAERALAADPGPAEAARQAQRASAAIASLATPLARLLAALQAEAASTEPPEPPEPPLAPAALHRALGELAALLENSDMRATDLMATLQQQAGRRLGPELQALDEAVGVLDFERALPLCRELLARTRP